MGNTAQNKVFLNDYIMCDILGLLNLRQQLELQRINKRLQFLTTCIWKRHYKDMQLNQSSLGALKDEEFFEMLQLNSDNINILRISQNDGPVFDKYFPVCYENLMELHIKSFRINNIIDIIVTCCPNLQLLDCNEDRNESRPPETEVQSFEGLWLLKHLKAIILKNLVGTVSYRNLCLLAKKIPLKQLEMYNVRLAHCGHDCWFSEFSTLKIFKTDCAHTSEDSDDKCLEFINECPNLEELSLKLNGNISDDFFEKFKKLEKIKLEYCKNALLLWRVLQHTNLKHLETSVRFNKKDKFKISQCVGRICSNIETLKVEAIEGWENEASNFWHTVMQTPLTSFENLQELSLINQEVCDEFMRIVSMKCHQLKILHLICCETSAKFINLLPNIENLIVENCMRPIYWSTIYNILQNLNKLKHLELDCKLLTRDDFVMPTNAQYIANSLETIKIRTEQGIDNFWEYISENCEDSFQNVHSFHFVHCHIGCSYDYSFYSNFPKLRTLKIEGKEFIAEDMIPTVHHLVLIDCINMRWSNVIEFLQCTRLEVLEIFDMSIYCDESPERLKNDKKLLRYLRKASIPYSVLQETWRFWQRCLEECPNFQLCCIGHTTQDEVLKLLLDGSSSKNRISAIHANRGLSSIKSYCIENMNTQIIPICVLDAKNKRLWNPRYSNKKCVILIEL